jgi:hypothetical protein
VNDSMWDTQPAACRVPRNRRRPRRSSFSEREEEPKAHLEQLHRGVEVAQQRGAAHIAQEEAAAGLQTRHRAAHHVEQVPGWTVGQRDASGPAGQTASWTGWNFVRLTTRPCRR